MDIDNNDGYEIAEEAIPGGVKNVLTIHNADEDDFGQYNCSVWNTFGQDSMIILLKKQSKEYLMNKYYFGLVTRQEIAVGKVYSFV